MDTLTVQRPTEVVIPQYSRKTIVAVWATAALPMAGLSWVVAPILARGLDGPAALARSLIITITAGLIWQCVMVLGLVFAEQRTLRWSVLREALWLRAPRSPRSGRVGGRLWWVALPVTFGFAAKEFLPAIAPPVNRDLILFLDSDAGRAFIEGAWGWYGLLLVMFVFNTMLGEELLFRGFLLPRMNGAFGKADWVVNGVLFGTYHLHVPWVIPSALLDMFLMGYWSKRYRSAWIGIIVHSSQSVVIALIGLTLVLG